MARWTAADIPALDGRTALVTGANSGLGFHTALELARRGAFVLITARSREKADGTAARIRAQVPAARLEPVVLDLADLASVRACAETLLGVHGHLDILVNNAGVMATPERRTADGFELQLATNHLGHFTLTGLLLPLLRARQGARVVAVSSFVAERGRIDLDDLQGERRYDPWRAYTQSKLANLMFALELHRRCTAAGVPLGGVAAHPGYTSTNIQVSGANLTGNRLRVGIMRTIARFGQPAARGALPQLYAATAPDVHGGEYVGPDGLGGWRGHPTLVRPPAQALDEDVARRLWDASETLTGVRYELLNATG